MHNGISIYQFKSRTDLIKIQDIFIEDVVDFCISPDGYYIYIALHYVDGIKTINLKAEYPFVENHFKNQRKFFANKIACNNNFIFTSYNNEFKIIDISYKNNPALLKAISFEASIIIDFKISENYLYIVIRKDEKYELVVINISEYYSPLIESIYKIKSETSYHLSMEINDNLIFINYSDFIEIIDISKKKNPELLSRFHVSSDYRCLTIDNNYLYVSSGKTFGIIDITNLKDPLIISEVEYKLTYSMNNYISINNNTAYISAEANGLYIFDITNKSNPVKINNISTNDIITDFVIQNNFCYILENRKKLKIFNIEKYENIELVSCFIVDGYIFNNNSK